MKGPNVTGELEELKQISEKTASGDRLEIRVVKEVLPLTGSERSLVFMRAAAMEHNLKGIGGGD